MIKQNINFIQKKFLIVLSIILTGCSYSFMQEEWNTGKFKISNVIFEYKLPKDWTILHDELNIKNILIAQKNDENFIIQQLGDTKTLSQTLYKEASKGFFYFHPISFSDELLVFQGKPSVNSPLREFHQKIIPIPNTEFFLYGSCSFEFMEGKTSDCKQIINSWKKSVDKK
ncbi:hypothetical protein KAI58_00225 [Candidatus Gracilibacteria bacterium]|nr:hypothetical protein [Candidatus Gracilibacteria bacterium]